jgi:hypothetical protein
MTVPMRICDTLPSPKFDSVAKVGHLAVELCLCFLCSALFSQALLSVCELCGSIIELFRSLIAREVSQTSKPGTTCLHSDPGRCLFSASEGTLFRVDSVVTKLWVYFASKTSVLHRWSCRAAEFGGILQRPRLRATCLSSWRTRTCEGRCSRSAALKSIRASSARPT